MKVSACKICDLCGDVVAKKMTFLYYTNKAFVTVRKDSPPDYANAEANTMVQETHYCSSCWKLIMLSAKEKHDIFTKNEEVSDG